MLGAFWLPRGREDLCRGGHGGSDDQQRMAGRRRDRGAQSFRALGEAEGLLLVAGEPASPSQPGGAPQHLVARADRLGHVETALEMLTGTTSRPQAHQHQAGCLACIHEIKPVKLPRCASPMARSLVAIAASGAPRASWTAASESSTIARAPFEPIRSAMLSASPSRASASSRCSAAKGTCAASCSVQERYHSAPRRRWMDSSSDASRPRRSVSPSWHATSLRASSASAMLDSSPRARVNARSPFSAARSSTS